MRKNIQLTLVFVKVPYSVLNFAFYTLIIFLMVLSLILLSVLTMQLSTPSVIGLLICSNILELGSKLESDYARHCRLGELCIGFIVVKT